MKRALLKRKGWMKRRAKPRAKKLKSVFRSKLHRDWIKTHWCQCGERGLEPCSGDVVASHIRIGTDGGTGFKPSDWWTLPLCDSHHKELHRGERSFYERYGIDPHALARLYWKHSPHKTERGPK
jgi:hypothetical protein